MEQKNKNKCLIISFFIGAGLMFVIGYFLARSNILNFTRENEEQAGEGELDKENKKSSVKDDSSSENEKMSESNFEYLDAKIKIGEKTFSIQIPTTDGAMIKGLGQKEKLEPDAGMLFVFSQAEKHFFNMEKMNFDLDFIFIEDDEVVDIKENISKDHKESIIGDKPYNQVLEITAGEIKRSGISIGDKANIIYR